MRENRTYGSEGGGIELNRSSLPLSLKKNTSPPCPAGRQSFDEHNLQNRLHQELTYVNFDARCF